MMRQMFMRGCGAAIMLAMPGLALAADAAGAGTHGHEAKPDVMAFDFLQFGMAIVVFLVAMFILAKTAWPKIMSGLEARENKIRSEVFAAEEARKAASAAQKEFERSLADARAESARMIESAKAETARAAAELRVQAETEINQMREQARANIEAAKKAAIADIYEQTATLATTVASKILQREVNEHDQRRLVEESVQQFTREYAGV